jgi:hypothetical protein
MRISRRMVVNKSSVSAMGCGHTADLFADKGGYYRSVSRLVGSHREN